MRLEFEMTEAQYQTILDACKPVPYIAAHCGPMSSPQENANRAWESLGREMGFKHMTVKPSTRGVRWFTAEGRS